MSEIQVNGVSLLSEEHGAGELIVAAMPSARLERVEGGHAIDPAHPVGLAFVDEVLARKEEPCIA